MIINQLNTDNIELEEYYNTVGISYSLSYATLSSITVKLDAIKTIETHNVYKVFINDTKSIADLQLLDAYFSANIYNPRSPVIYDPLVKQSNEGTHFILFRKNEVVNAIMDAKKGNTSMYINICKLKKNASRCFPIVYIL